MHCICKIGEREIEREGEECSTLEVCSKLIILFISLNILPGSPRSPDANNYDSVRGKLSNIE